MGAYIAILKAPTIFEFTFLAHEVLVYMDFDHPRPKKIIFEAIKGTNDFIQNLTQHHIQNLTLSLMHFIESHILSNRGLGLLKNN